MPNTEKWTDEMFANDRTCPVCRSPYTDHPATSRTDNELLICPRCGVVEAMLAAGFDEASAQAIADVAS